MLAPSSRTSTMRCGSIPPQSLHPLNHSRSIIIHKNFKRNHKNHGEYANVNKASRCVSTVQSVHDVHSMQHRELPMRSHQPVPRAQTQRIHFGNGYIFVMCCPPNGQTLDCLLYCCSFTKLTSPCCIAWHGLTG